MGHIHADSMKLYAEDAAKHPRPWELWEVRRPTLALWRILRRHPNWTSDTQYRRKPQTTQYRLALMNYGGCYQTEATNDPYAPTPLSSRTTFVRWITDWVEIEV